MCDLYLLIIDVCVYVPLHICGGQRTTLRSQFSPSTMWTLGTELRPTGVVKSAFTCGVISTALSMLQ